MAARLAPGSADDTLANCRDRIADDFYPVHGFGKARLGVAKKAITDYRRATSDAAGTIDLMVTYLEHGTQFAADFAVDDERFYASLGSVLVEMANQMGRPDTRELLDRFRDRLVKVRDVAKNLGYGYGDLVVEVVSELEATRTT